MTATTFTVSGFGLIDNGSQSSFNFASTAPGRIVTVRVTLHGLSHTSADDLDFLLISPTGRSFAFLTDAGGSADLIDASITIADSGTAAIPDNAATAISSGTYRAASYGEEEAAENWLGPSGSANIRHAAPADGHTFNTAFGGVNGVGGNGFWALHIRDDAPGEIGALAGGWSIEIITTTGKGNFNAGTDFRSDLLWRHDGGAVSTWSMNSNTASSNAFQSFVSPDWQIQGIGDFNNDGRSDLLWRNTISGQITTWEMNGATTTPNVFQAAVSNDFRIDGIGDFNGDGRDDILFRHTSGQITTWQMNGATATPNVFSANVGNDWRIVGVGDFNADGRDDIAWRNVNGQLTTWQMDGATATANVLNLGVGTDWHVIGTGDFNGDGRDDILWRNDGGRISTWHMNGPTVTPNAFQADVGLDFQVVQIGDFDGDGRDDLLWRHTSTGQIASWEFEGDGTSVTPNVFQANVGLDWTIQTNQYDFV